LASILELAQEWSGYLKKIYIHYFSKNGKTLEPGFMLIIYALHHTLSILALPMNLYYYDNYFYFRMIGS